MRAMLVMSIMLALLISGCAMPFGTQEAPQQNETGEINATPEPEARQPALLASSHPVYGRILTDAQGMTLYVFTKDEYGKSNCYEQCAKNWPPLLADDPVAPEGLEGELGTVERIDTNVKQVTYNGMPLYRFVNDYAIGDVNGQGVNGVWFVATEGMLEFPKNETAEEAANATVKEFSMTAKRFEFNPKSITVKKGDTVRITLTSEDVTHGFAINEFNVSERVEPGSETTVEFVADTAGTFVYYCNIPCGPSHSIMRGQLIVEE